MIMKHYNKYYDSKFDSACMKQADLNLERTNDFRKIYKYLEHTTTYSPFMEVVGSDRTIF